MDAETPASARAGKFSMTKRGDVPLARLQSIQSPYPWGVLPSDSRRQNLRSSLHPLSLSALCCNAQYTFSDLAGEPLLSETRIKLIEAIARKQTVTARYNGAVIKLAPHLLFERRGDLFISALNMSKSWRTDDERRLGQFKLAGLAATELLDEGFDPLPTYEAAAPRSDDTLILTI
jgi:hypothetical protein